MLRLHARPSVVLVGAAMAMAYGSYVMNSRKFSHAVALQNGNRFVPVERSCGGL